MDRIEPALQWNDSPAACLHGLGVSACADCRVRQISVCAALDPHELTEIDSLSHPTAFPAKSTLFTQEDPASAVFNITEGMVRLYKLLPDGRRQIVGFALAGDFLGLALLDRYGVSADAITDTKVCRFSRSAFTAFLDKKPHLLRRLHEFASHELSLAQDQMVLLGRRTADERIAAFLMSLKERFARIGHTSITLPLPMSRQDIADFLGLTIETVSRTFSKLAKSGVIVVVPDGVRLTNLAQIKALATR
ncbi:Crp/Fnr family transcriptional regulator [Microvirga terricola]|uniref:Crp/Fnr family transcriptional regulator n=1 Tax=Microvirga terricola TaxID=2719797 RepID=UPI0031BA221E